MKIKEITKENYKGLVYNLELNSNGTEDDLFWVEGSSGIVTHNCFPKDLSALIYLADGLNIDTTVLTATKTKNDMVRTDLDWTRQIGRAVSED